MAFPSTYSVGITSLGYQLIWATLAEREDVDIRRMFTDQEEKPHKNIDLFGLSLSWELDGPVLLNFLEKQKIPLWSHQRNNNDPIVFGGGPVLTANPEPFAPFFDVILMGDGESLLPKFIETLKQVKQENRSNRLITLAKVDGIYVPGLYVPKYSADGQLETLEATTSELPKTIRKQTWQGETLSYSKVITPESVWPNIHMVEVVRSCPELCRFCLASYLTLPFRSAPLREGLIPAVEKGLKVTNRIGLLGASVTQHPEFLELLEWLNQDQFNHIRLSLSSVRAATVTKKMIEILQHRGCKSITMAIESGSERMRAVINKKLSEEEIFNAAKYTLEGGLKGIKLYGMVGLPTEQEEDLDQTIELMLKLKKENQGLRITFGVSTFVPKAHTPFQWYGLRIDAKKQLKLLNKKLKSNGVVVRPESFNGSIVQTLISRSDRRLAPVIEAIRKSHNNLSQWKYAYKANQEKGDSSQEKQPFPMPKLPAWEEVVHENWDLSRALPWSHLQGPVSKEVLLQHQEQAIRKAL